MAKNLKGIKKFLEIFSLATNKSRIIVFTTTLIILTIVPVSNLESIPNLSLCKLLIEEKCYSVGITRGISSLLKLKFEQAINYNWLSLPALLTIFTILIKDIYQIKTIKNKK